LAVAAVAVVEATLVAALEFPLAVVAAAADYFNKNLQLFQELLTR
jgi:hypothetical protein